MTFNERELKAVEQALGRYATEISDIWHKQTEANRAAPPEEREEEFADVLANPHGLIPASIRTVRAILQALIPPSEGMVEAGVEAINGGDPDWDYHHWAIATWEAMIQHILGER